MKIGEFFDKLAGAETDTPSAPKQTAVPKPPRQPVKLPTLTITGVVFIVFLVGASFFLGAVYEKSQQPTAQTLGSNNNGSSSSQPNQSQSGGSASSGGFGGGGGGYGQMYRSSMTTSQVTAVSSTSITTQDSSGNTTTYTISSETVITDDGQQVDASSISTGDTVIIIPDRADPTTARRIIVNPSTNGNTQPTTVSPDSSQLD